MDASMKELCDIWIEAIRKNDTDIRVCIIAIMGFLIERSGRKAEGPTQMLSSFTKGERKRAIKYFRMIQAQPERKFIEKYREETEGAIAFIRCNPCAKEVVA